MRLLIFQTIRFNAIGYEKLIDHNKNLITYIGIKEDLNTIPENINCRRIVISNEEASYHEAKSFMKNEQPFDAIIAVCELDLMNAAKLRQEFDLPGARPETVAKYIDKIIMKDAISSAGILVPKYISCLDLLNSNFSKEPFWQGKTVVKPLEGTSSKNVTIFSTYAQALEFIKNKINSEENFHAKDYELEEFIEGPHIHFDGVMHHGSLFTAIRSKYIGTCFGFYQCGEPSASIQLDDNKDDYKWAEECARAVGIEDGVFHIEAILSNQHLVFMEIAARAAGAGITDIFQKAAHINLHEYTLHDSIKQSIPNFSFKAEPTWEKPIRSQNYYGVFKFAGHHLNSDFCTIEGLNKFHNHPSLEQLFILPKEKKLTRYPTSVLSQLPLAGFVKGNSPAELENFIYDLFNTIKISSA